MFPPKSLDGIALVNVLQTRLSFFFLQSPFFFLVLGLRLHDSRPVFLVGDSARLLRLAGLPGVHLPEGLRRQVAERAREPALVEAFDVGLDGLRDAVNAGALQAFPDALVDALLGDAVFRGCLLFGQLAGEYAPSNLHPFAWRAVRFHPP